MKNRNTMIGTIQLLLCALIWGVAFVAQSVGMEYVGPFTFNAVRNLMGAVVLLPCIWFLQHRKGGSQSGLDEKENSRENKENKTDREGKGGKRDAAAVTGKTEADRHDRKMLLQGGLVCGFLLCVAGNLQQIGILYTTVGKAGFITAMYIVLVPLLGIFFGRKAGLRIWISVLLAVVGLYLLSMKESLRLGKGDFCIFLSAFAFALQIMAVDYYVHRVEGVWLAQLQFLVCGGLTLIPMVLTEHVSIQGLMAARIPILYAGLLSCGVAYTMQILGQEKVPPALASLLMSLESVISALAGWLLLSQKLSGRELTGCVIMFAAILLAQISENPFKAICGRRKESGR